MSVILRGGSAEAHASASPGAVDYVLDEVKADSTAVAVFDGAASATLSLQSTRVGAATTATVNATAIGYGATASGINSLAVRGTASADTAISVGVGSSAAGQYSIAIGKSSIAGVAGVGASSIAIGAGASAAAQADCIVLASTTSGAVITATTATSQGDVIVGSGAGLATGYLRGNQVAQTYAIVAATNDLVPTSAGNATLTAGRYTPTALAAHAQSAMNAQIAGAGFTVSYSTSTDLFTFARGSAFSMAWGAAGTAYAEFGFAQTTSGSATSHVSAFGRPDAPDLSPAVAGAVDLGTPLRWFGSIYVDAVYPRTRATDYFIVSVTPPGGNMGTNTGAYVTFPSASGCTIVGAGAASSQFSLATSGNACGILRSSAAAFAVTALVTFEIRVTALKLGGTAASGGIQVAMGTNTNLSTGYLRIGTDCQINFITAQQDPNVHLAVTRLVTFPASTATYVVPQWFGNVPGGGTNGVWPAVANHTFQFIVRVL